MYLVSAFLCAYAGFAALCAITTRNIPLVWTTPPSRRVVTTLRVAGFSLLGLSWLPCYWMWDGPMGTAAWTMNLSASGFALIFPFAYSPKRSVQFGGVAMLLAVLVALVR
jgi:Protein of unknown function (DUF3325)